MASPGCPFRSSAALIAAVLLFGAGRADAVLVAYDPFLTGDDRPAGQYSPAPTVAPIVADIRTQGPAALGWVGMNSIDGFGIPHTGTTSNFQVNATGENSPAVTYEQGGRMQWLGVGNSPGDRNITRQLNPTPESSEWWFSIMVNRLGWADPPAAATSTFVVGGFTDAGGNGLQVGFDDSAGDGIPDLVLRTNLANNVLIADAGPNNNRLVLVKLEINTSGNENLSIWADPDTLNPLGAPTVVISDQDIFSTLNPFTQSKYESPGQSGAAFFDEIRLATTFEDATGIVPSTGTPGDYNDDGFVDAADYTVWRDNLGTAAVLPNDPTGGTIDTAQYDTWKTNFGLPATGAVGGAAVPEPGASLALLLCLGAAGLGLTRRAR
ncbi:hypothetical protein Pla175_21840 [Pirellulimonas nuda]|uniref:PEP-CTERM protein-sorting domain-containing protein n=1 Tax=Pirellulimonas nuda TaxID=2528009 RepID=A0A518DBF1_9BACT|nr:hypothetical protein [Pirellulimonas nuda]QDU88800.1 hypothetical protein Pla175_21840 [Pirellulimonas nuda]